MNTTNSMQRCLTPLLGLSIFALACGYLTTLIPLRINNNNVGEIISGFMGAVYYLGFLAGSFRTERILVRIGHIRSFAAFMALLCSTVLSLSLFTSTSSWLLLRFLNGVAIAGIFVVVESWLLCESDQSNRGRTLALYMVTLYGANAVGQLLVGVIDSNSLMPFIVIGILFSLSILPPALSRIPSPEVYSESSLSIYRLFKLTPSAVLGCITGGLVMGAIYSLLPLYLLEKNTNDDDTGTMLFILMAGGMLLQYPIGRLSDFIDRRKVLISVSLVGCISCLFYIWFSEGFWANIFLLFVLGGTTFTLYPLAISHGCDHMEPVDIVAGTQGLLFSYSSGACIGPIIASFFMHNIDGGLMIYFAVVMGMLASFFLLRLQYRPAIYSFQDQPFVLIPRTTPVTAQINPRSDAPDIFDQNE